MIRARNWEEASQEPRGGGRGLPGTGQEGGLRCVDTSGARDSSKKCEDDVS